MQKLYPLVHITNQQPTDFKVCKRHTSRTRKARARGLDIEVTENSCSKEDESEENSVESCVNVVVKEG